MDNQNNQNNQIENSPLSNFLGGDNQNHSNQKIFWIGGIIVLVILAIIGGVFYFSSPRKSSSNKVAQNQVNQTNNSSATANWKTYQNKELGFEFKYPGKWYIYNEQSKIFIQPDKEEKSNIPGPHAQALELSISATHNKTLSQVVEERKAKNTSIKYRQSETTIGRQKAIQLISICEGVGCGAPEWFVIKDGFLYYFNSNLGYSNVFNQILSTFKFTDQPSGWQVYSNDNLGFKFKIEKKYANLVKMDVKKVNEKEWNICLGYKKEKGSFICFFANPLSWLSDKVSKKRDEKGRVIWDQEIPLIKKKGERIYVKGQNDGYPHGEYLGENNDYVFYLGIAPNGCGFSNSFLCLLEGPIMNNFFDTFSVLSRN